MIGADDYEFPTGRARRLHREREQRRREAEDRLLDAIGF
jgi:hypothetical protein